MSSPQHSSDLIAESVTSEEFDPVTEIKKLRQNITHRLQVLHTSTVPVSEEDEPKAISSTVYSEYSDGTDENVLADNSSVLLTKQISHVRQLLSQLQTAKSEDLPLFKAKENVQKPKENKFKSKDKSEKTSTLYRQLLPSLDTLKLLNIVLTWFGFLGIIIGILFSLQYLNQDCRLGTPIAVAGLMLIAVGLLGRFYHFTVHEAL